MKHKLAPLLFLLACAASAPAQSKKFQARSMQAARGGNGALATGSNYSEEAGMRVFLHGGNAVDAGVAALFAAAVAEFSNVGMGGETPILIRTKTGKVYAIAGVGPMPRLATAKFFMEHRSRSGEILTIDPGGLKRIIPVAGILPALVPGTVGAGLVALLDFGTKSLSEEIEPAIELADGMAIDKDRSDAIERSRDFFKLWPDSKRTFLPSHRVPLPGEIFHQPNLARTLRSMATAEKKALASGASRAAAIDAVAD